MDKQFDLTRLAELRQKLKDQIHKATEAGDYDRVQLLTSLGKRLDNAVAELISVDAELNGQPSKLASAPVNSARIQISAGDLKQNLFRTKNAKRQGMHLPENMPVAIDLVGPSGTRTIQTETMDYKFRARRQFGEYYAELRLGPGDWLLLEETGPNRFRIRKP
ncbi:MAG: hypothetical protein WA005_14235 [Candidatus Binataceae bacterium]